MKNKVGYEKVPTTRKMEPVKLKNELDHSKEDKNNVVSGKI